MCNSHSGFGTPVACDGVEARLVLWGMGEAPSSDILKVGVLAVCRMAGEDN
jgi:hypothetical protein